MSRALKQDGLLEFSKLFEAEFNQPGLHDKVLIFDVVASWPRRRSDLNVEENETSEAGGENEEESHDETAENENVETIMNTSDQNETESQDCAIASKHANATSYPTSEGRMIRQHKFYIHSSWLAVQSSYFRSLFFSRMRETNANEVRVRISESEEKAHLMLLEAMYKIDTLDNTNVDELLEVFRLAHKYDVKLVLKQSKYCLQAMVNSIEIFESIMHFVKVNLITDVEDLEKMLQSFLAKEFSPLDKTWQTKRFEQLSEATLKYLLSSDELVAASENTVFHALMHWIEQRGIDKVLESTELPPLLSVVRVELMSIDYLYNIAQHNAIAKKLPDFKDHYIRGINYHALSNVTKRSLPHQPVKRKASTWWFIPYTWVIATDKLDQQVQSGKPLKSDEFWYCGYRMVLIINEVVKIEDLERNKAVFNATLSLAVTNLTEQSEVVIEWKATSSSFTTTPAEQNPTFKKQEDVSSVNIRYKMEVRPGSPNPICLSIDVGMHLPQSGEGGFCVIL